MALSLFSEARQQAAEYARARPLELEDEPTGYLENYRAVHDAAIAGRLTTSRADAAWTAYDRWMENVERETGVKLPNPWDVPDAVRTQQIYEDNQRRVAELIAGRTDVGNLSMFDRDMVDAEFVKQYAPEFARQQNVEAQQNVGGFFGSLAGEAVAFLRDPVTVLSLPFGAGPGKTILQTALTEAAIGVGTEAATVATTARSRQLVEPDFGVTQALTEIGGAGVGAGLIGGGLAGLGRIWNRVRSGREWPRQVKDAGNVVDQGAFIENTAPRKDSETVSRHQEAFLQAADDLANGRRVEIDPETFQKFNQRTGRVFDADNRQIAVGYEIVDASELVTSHDADLRLNPEFPQELQPRQRDRAISVEQIVGIGRNLEPERLGPSSSADQGAPIVGPDGVVESGNARVLGINRAYDQNDVAALNYREWLRSQGFEIDDIERPILIARRTSDLTPADRAAFATAANRASALRLSPTEQAIADAKLISRETLGLLDGDNLAAEKNSGFVRGFLKGLPRTEHGNVIDKNGRLSQAGVNRIESALIARAFGRLDVLDRVLESTNNNVRRIGRAMIGSSPRWAQMRDAIAAGQIAPHMDQTDALLDAIGIVMRARDEGVPVREIADQMSLLGDDVLGMRRNWLASMFKDGDYTKPVSQRRLQETLDAYADEAMNVGTQPGFLDDTVTPERALGAILERQGRQDIAAELFGAIDDDAVDAALKDPDVDAAVDLDVDRMRAAAATTEGAEPLMVPVEVDGEVRMVSVDELMDGVDQEIAEYENVINCTKGTEAAE